MTAARAVPGFPRTGTTGLHRPANPTAETRDTANRASHPNDDRTPTDARYEFPVHWPRPVL